jgi:hypothetical protein
VLLIFRCPEKYWTSRNPFPRLYHRALGVGYCKVVVPAARRTGERHYQVGALIKKFEPVTDIRHFKKFAGCLTFFYSFLFFASFSGSHLPVR